MSKYLYHITSKTEWTQTVGNYIPKNFAIEGFIHCSYISQIVGSANKHFHQQNDLVILKIDRDRITSEIVDENLEGGSMLFPHLYGHLPKDAVVEIIDFPCKVDGSFELPSTLKS